MMLRMLCDSTMCRTARSSYVDLPNGEVVATIVKYCYAI